MRGDPGVSTPAPPGDIEVRAIHGPSEPEVRGLEQLLETTMTFDGHRPMGEQALIELKQGPRAFPHAAFAAYVRGELAGYAHLSERPSAHGWRLEAFTAPAFRGRGVATTLLTSVNAHIASHGGGRIHVWAYHPGWAQGRLARRFGMRLIRTLYRMERSLPMAPEPLPAGFSIRSFSPGVDDDAWLALHNAVFADHPDAGGWGLEDLAWHREEEWFDPDGLLLASDGMGPAGYCWMKQEGDLGWLYFLGVHPRARGSGLAGSLCALGFGRVGGNGASMGLLYVDESNVAAVRLYDKLGFVVGHADHCYELLIPAAG